MKISPKSFKVAGLGILCIPLVLLLVLGIGEMSGGIYSGLQHLIQAIPIILFMYFAWVKPKIGGVILIFLSIILALLYLFFPPVSMPSIYRVENTILLFSPLLLSGILFLRAQKSNHKTSIDLKPNNMS